jgi:intein/homing endonuclease
VAAQPEWVIGTTHEHPFFVHRKGWTPAGELQPGDLIRTLDGWVPVKGVENTGRIETVYKLEIEDDHTY